MERARNEAERTERREAIIKAARTVFWKDGFQGATMPRIAQTARVAAGTLYLYFPSKEALYAELLVEGYNRLSAALRDAVSDRASAERRARQLIDGFLGFARRHPEYFDIIFFVVQREGRGPGDVLHGAQLDRLHAAEGDCKRIAEQALAGLRIPARDRRARLEAVWSMLAGVVFYFKRDDDATFAAVSAAARRILLAGVEA